MHFYNKAFSDKQGTLKFHISNNEGSSSSIGTLKKDWSNQKIKMVREIEVPCINLMAFIKEKNITEIDNYVSDIQGFDLMVLKTLEPMISKGKIKSISSEVAKDAYKNIYENAPDNSFSAFKNYLEKYHYGCVAISPMTKLKDGVFEEIPEEWWEFDAKFTYKSK